jgi:hypothetical protein
MSAETSCTCDLVGYECALHEKPQKPTPAEIAPAAPPERKKAERTPNKGDEIPLGSWWWLRVKSVEDDGTTDSKGTHERLVCVTELGSNYAKCSTVEGTYWRIHLDDRFPDVVRPCPNAPEVIARSIKGHQAEVSKLLAEVREVTAQIGLSSAPQPTADETGAALAKLSGVDDVGVYQSALVKAQKETLPELFKQIKEQNELSAMWMSAELLPIKAMAEQAQGVIGKIEGRIFDVSIYAGLSEKAKQVCEGEPAQASEKLRVFQNMVFMDEEALLDYRHGGMEFASLKKFDEWLAQPKNLGRILPFPRCMVAMRVRRHAKDRSEDEAYAGQLGAFICFKNEVFDKKTFLYVRNGAQLFRIDSQLEFGNLIFPSRNEFSTEPMMFKKDFDKVMFRTVREHEDLIAKKAWRDRLSKEWEKAHPWKAEERKQYLKWKQDRTAWREERRKERRAAEGQLDEWQEWKGGKLVERSAPKLTKLHKDQANHKFSNFRPNNYKWCRANPHRKGSGGYNHEDYFDSWEPFDKSTVHYDEALKTLTDRAKQWNRVALVIQGLFDRSEVLHPHPPVQSWTPEGFNAAIELIYDGEQVLECGEPPDFEAYRARLNESLGDKSWTIGQQGKWLEREREREQKRRDNDWRLRDSEKHVNDWWQPSGNDGPGFLAEIETWRKNACRAVYRWTREPRRWSADPKKIPESIEVEAEYLFNASAYTPGDYLQFFQDPRTRAEYVRWAPFLLTAEDWKAGAFKAKRVDKHEFVSVGGEHADNEEESEDETDE